MKIFVINLPEHIERRDAIGRQLSSFSLDYEIMPGVRGNALSGEELKYLYDERRARRTFFRPLRSSEIGCALSHIKIYQRIVDLQCPFALILEDDAWLNPDLPFVFSAIEKNYSPMEPNVFLLSATFDPARKFKRYPAWSRYVFRKIRSAMGTYGYVVTLRAAQSLIANLQPVHHPSDCWGWLIRHRVVQAFGIFPPCITVDMSHDSTTLEDISPCASSSIASKLFHVGYRIFWEGMDQLDTCLKKKWNR